MDNTEGRSETLDVRLDEALEGDRALLGVVVELELGVVIQDLDELRKSGLKLLGISEIRDDLVDLCLDLGGDATARADGGALAAAAHTAEALEDGVDPPVDVSVGLAVALDDSVGVPDGVSLQLHDLIQDSLHNLDALLVVGRLALVIDH